MSFLLSLLSWLGCFPVVFERLSRSPNFSTIQSSRLLPPNPTPTSLLPLAASCRISRHPESRLNNHYSVFQETILGLRPVGHGWNTSAERLSKRHPDQMLNRLNWLILVHQSGFIH